MVKTKKQQFFHIYAICANMHLNSSAQCSGTSSGPVNLSWTRSAGAQSYTVQRRLLNPPGLFEPLQTLPAESLGNPVLNYPDTTVQTGSTYEYQIMATNPSGATLSDIKSVTTPSCIPPTITSLEIKNVGNTTTFAGSNVSGRQSSQQGSNWFNPIQVTLSAQANPIGSGNSIKEYYINFSPGFRLEYRRTQPDSTTYAPFVVSDDNIITNITAFPEGFRLIERDRFVGLLKYIGTNSTDSRWEVTFDQNFGDRNMNITGRVKDQNNLCGDTNGNIVSCDNNVDLSSVQRVIR